LVKLQQVKPGAFLGHGVDSLAYIFVADSMDLTSTTRTQVDTKRTNSMN